jgi:23S rRNA (cytosine1962-C5)-methyltransferase
MDEMPKIHLKKGRERSVLRHHPWIFSGAIEDVQGEPKMGETVEVLSHAGEWLARAAYSPHSQIRARIWTWNQEEDIDAAFLQRKIGSAIDARRVLSSDPDTNAYREVNAESDALPGLIVDRYADFRVIQFLSASAERWREEITASLVEDGKCRGIYERSDVEVREKEGLQMRTGTLWGTEPEDELEIIQDGLRFLVDVRSGQKTGFYLDQRENRRIVRSMINSGDVLNCFSYTGGFSAAALAGGAETVLSLDSSSAAMDLARRNIELNRLELGRCEWLNADAFEALRELRDRRRSFNVIIMDPPRFASTASQSQRAARGYKDINLLGFKLLRKGGLLITFSCSGGVSSDLFQKIVAGAAVDAGVRAVVVVWLGQPTDHPVALNFPEGRYLKGIICRVFDID